LDTPPLHTGTIPSRQHTRKALLIGRFAQEVTDTPREVVGKFGAVGGVDHRPVGVSAESIRGEEHGGENTFAVPWREGENKPRRETSLRRTQEGIQLLGEEAMQP